MKLFYTLLCGVFALSLHAQPPVVTIDRVSYTIFEEEGYAIASNPSDELLNENNQDIIILNAVEFNGSEYPVTHFWGYQTAGEGQKICLPEGLIEIRGSSPNAIFETIPLSIERILEEAFYDNILPQELYLPNIKAIGPMSFYCDELETLHLGSSLEVVGSYPFGGSIKEVVFEDGIPGMPLALTWQSLSTLPQKEFKIPYRTPLSISDCCMEYNDQVERVVFPAIEEIKYGGKDAFTNITIIVPLKGYFFKNCPKLKEIVCLGSIPPEITNLDLIDSYTFSKITEFNITDNMDQCILKVPAGSEEKYRQDPIWGKFKTICGFENGDYTSISTVPAAEPTDATPVYYNLQGMKVTNPAKGQLYIRTTGSKTEKIVL